MKYLSGWQAQLWRALKKVGRVVWIEGEQVAVTIPALANIHTVLGIGTLSDDPFMAIN